jgi:hypothetical protein
MSGLLFGYQSFYHSIPAFYTCPSKNITIFSLLSMAVTILLVVIAPVHLLQNV